MNSGSSWNPPSGHDNVYSPYRSLHPVPKSSEDETHGLLYASYYDAELLSTPPPPSLGTTNVANKPVWSLEHIMAINGWSLSPPPPMNFDSYPVTPEALMTASPIPIITIPQSIFPSYPEHHPLTWESVPATNSPLLVPTLATDRDPSPSPILVKVPPTLPEGRQLSHKAQLLPPDFLQNCFPLDDEAHAQKREALERVMTADWKIQNQMEPHECYLLDFMRLDSQRNRWTCTFYTGGVPCGSSYKKKDQAKGHIRFHLQHFPYACLDAGPCPIKSKSCRKRYCAAEPRQKHRAIKTRCPSCKKPMLRGNVKRHQETACTQQTTTASSPEYSSAYSPSHD